MMTSMKIENNFYIWNKKDKSEPLSEFFKTNELSCKCLNPSCEEQKASIELIMKLTEVRKEYGDSVVVTSGYRCASHQQALAASGKETAKNSQHVLGNAVDISAKDIEKLWLIAKKHFSARGKANSFVHLDVRKQALEWFYKKS